jgi:hypothetical protein
MMCDGLSMAHLEHLDQSMRSACCGVHSGA